MLHSRQGFTRALNHTHTDTNQLNTSLCLLEMFFPDRTEFTFSAITAILSLATKSRTFSPPRQAEERPVRSRYSQLHAVKPKNFISFLLLQPFIHSCSSLISNPSLFDSASHNASPANFISTFPLSYAKIINESTIRKLALDKPLSLLERGISASTALIPPHLLITRL